VAAALHVASCLLRSPLALARLLEAAGSWFRDDGAPRCARRSGIPASASDFNGTDRRLNPFLGQPPETKIDGIADCEVLRAFGWATFRVPVGRIIPDSAAA
jgi:hypothetical protein